MSARRAFAEHWLLLALGVLLIARMFVLADFMTHIDDIGVLFELLDSEGQGLMAQVRRARNWTYAPAQVLIQAVTLRLAADANGVLFWGRLPSLLAWFAGLVLARRLYREAFPERAYLADVLVVLQAVSHRGLIESSQAYNYATTAPVAAAALTFFLREGLRLQGELRPLSAQPVRAIGAFFGVGFALGGLCWVTYQAPFVLAGGLLGLGLVVLGRGPSRVAMVRLAMLGLLIATPLNLVFHFHLKHVAHRGVPDWIPDATPQGMLDLPAAWWRVVQSVLAFLPWGAGSAAIGVLVVATIGAATIGAAWSLRRRGLDERSRVILACSLGIAAVFSAGALLERVPLSHTRHSYVLQVPVLLLLGWALDRLALGPRFARGLVVALLCVGLVSAVSLQQRTRVQLDLAAVERIAADPGVAVVGGPDFTWDHMLLLRSHPEWRGRLITIDLDIRNAAALPPALLLLSHRAPPWSERLKVFGYTQRGVIQAVDPIGSTELVGNINGGNGGFIYLLRR